MNGNMTYKPNRYNIIFIPFFVLGILFYAWMFGITLENKNYQLVVVSCLFIILFLFLTKNFYDSSKAVIIFEEDSLRIINDKKREHSLISLENFSYGYYRNSYKGHLYLVLSQELLEANEVKKIVNRCHNLSKIQHGNVITINLFTANKEEIIHIKEIISKNVTYINEM